MNKILKSLLLVLVSTVVFAQNQANIVKVNLSAVALGAAGIQYERHLGSRFSFSIGAAYRAEKKNPYASSIEKYVNYFDNKIEYISLENVRKTDVEVGVLQITPEFRYYFGKKGKNQTGPYLSAFGRYNDFKGFIPVFLDTYYHNEPTHIELPANTKLESLSAGLMIGYQFQLGKRWVLDWYILGGHVGKANLKSELIRNLEGFDDEFLGILKSELIKTFQINQEYLQLETSKQGITLENIKTLKYANLRGLGFNLGYRFLMQKIEIA